MKNPASDTTAKTAKEETVLYLFRDLSLHQQRELLDEMRAMSEANRISKRVIGGRTLRPASNEVVAAAFKAIPVPGKKKKAPSRKSGRPPDAPMDDYPDPGSEKP